MRYPQFFTLSSGVLILGITSLSAQIPKVGPAPVVKPGDAGKQPVVKQPDPVKPNPGVNPNPNPGVNPNPMGTNPKGVVPPGGNPAIVPPGMPKNEVPPLNQPKKEVDNFPKEIGEKSLAMWISELKTSKDASARENAIHTLPMFGPRAMLMGSDVLLDKLKNDTDLNVKIAALNLAPYMSYNQQEDPNCNDRLDTIIRLLNTPSAAMRYEAANVLGGIGPVAKKSISQLVVLSNEPSSWQLRRAAANALGSIGRGWVNPDNPAEKIDANDAAVKGLLDQLRTDPAVTVRKEAANSLIQVGPVSTTQYKLWRTTLDNVLKNEKDHTVVGLVRVAILKNDPAGVKGNEALMTAITNQLLAPETTIRLEACQALGMLGDLASKKAQDLLDVVTNPKEDLGVTAAAVVAIANMRTQAGLTVPVLKKVSETHRNEDIRKYATEAVNILQGGVNKGVLPGVAEKK